MYICICNALRDRDITLAVQGGASTVDEAYAACGTATACGQCREDAEAFIRGVATGCCGAMEESAAA